MKAYLNGVEVKYIKDDGTWAYYKPLLKNGKTGRGRPSKTLLSNLTVEKGDEQLLLDLTPEQDAVNLEVETETVVEE